MEASNGQFATKARDRSLQFAYATARNDEESDRKENVSLEAQFDRFLASPTVRAYYAFVPMVASLLSRVRKTYGDSRILAQLVDNMQRKQSASTKEISPLYVKIQDELIKMLEELAVNEERVNLKALQPLLQRYWSGTLKKFTQAVSGSRPFLSAQYILEDLIGMGITRDEESYQKDWADALWNLLSVDDLAHFRVIANLDETERELKMLYSDMENIVNYDSLVMITMWRLAHSMPNEQPQSIEAIVNHPEQWVLAYGTFCRDYPVFLKLHQTDYRGYPVHINLFYIDFDASGQSQASHIDLLHKDRQSPISFAAYFAEAGASLELSYMRHE